MAFAGTDLAGQVSGSDGLRLVTVMSRLFGVRNCCRRSHVRKLRGCVFAFSYVEQCSITSQVTKTCYYARYALSVMSAEMQGEVALMYADAV